VFFLPRFGAALGVLGWRFQGYVFGSVRAAGSADVEFPAFAYGQPGSDSESVIVGECVGQAFFADLAVRADPFGFFG